MRTAPTARRTAHASHPPRAFKTSRTSKRKHRRTSDELDFCYEEKKEWKTVTPLRWRTHFISSLQTCVVTSDKEGCRSVWNGKLIGRSKHNRPREYAF
ncbi:hypothetical protein KC351_g31 [Hortaea werneckii]|nr:hypothetical protein KC351_g31 [Hortaea werneckii]